MPKKERDGMNIFSNLFRSRDKPIENSTVGGAYKF